MYVCLSEPKQMDIVFIRQKAIAPTSIFWCGESDIFLRTHKKAQKVQMRPHKHIFKNN